MQRSVVLLHHSLPLKKKKTTLLIRISGRERKIKTHTLRFKKKSQDFKTAYLRNDKHCETTEAFTCQNRTKAFQPYKTLFQSFKVFPQSFHHGFCTFMAINSEVIFNIRITKREANSRMLPAGPQNCRGHSYDIQSKYLLPTSLQSQTILRKKHDYSDPIIHCCQASS